MSERLAIVLTARAVNLAYQDVRLAGADSLLAVVLRATTRNESLAYEAERDLMEECAWT